MLNSTLFLSLIQVCPLITRSYLQAKLLAWTKIENSSFFRIDELSNSYFSKNKFLFWIENVMVRLSHICNEEKYFKERLSIPVPINIFLSSSKITVMPTSSVFCSSITLIDTTSAYHIFQNSFSFCKVFFYTSSSSFIHHHQI